MKRKIARVGFHDRNAACGMDHYGSILAEVCDDSFIEGVTFSLDCHSYEDYRCGDMCRGYIERTITSVVPVSVDDSVRDYMRPLSYIRDGQIHYQ